MADFNVNHITGKQGQQGTVLAGVTTVSSTGAMRIPSGPTEQRGGRGRGVIMGGYGYSPSGAYVNNIDYITIATTGNATDFGDMNVRSQGGAATTNSVRATFAGGQQESPSYTLTNYIDYVTIASTGNAIDFGDLTAAISQTTAVSDTNGGLG